MTTENEFEQPSTEDVSTVQPERKEVVMSKDEFEAFSDADINDPATRMNIYSTYGLNKEDESIVVHVEGEDPKVVITEASDFGTRDKAATERYISEAARSVVDAVDVRTEALKSSERDNISYEDVKKIGEEAVEEVVVDPSTKWAQTAEEFDKLTKDLQAKRVADALRDQSSPFHGDETDNGGLNGNARTPEEIQELVRIARQMDTSVGPETQKGDMTHEQELLEMTKHLSNNDKKLLDDYAFAAAAAQRAISTGELDNQKYYGRKKREALQGMSSEAHSIAGMYFNKKYPLIQK